MTIGGIRERVTECMRNVKEGLSPVIGWVIQCHCSKAQGSRVKTFKEALANDCHCAKSFNYLIKQLLASLTDVTVLKE